MTGKYYEIFLQAFIAFEINFGIGINMLKFQVEKKQTN
jgi:hypothetical protein